ncbi:phage holin family protein [Pseudomonas luteola]|uniref:phage holin family protein n=1 Tax=Pseudomonas luteola TaxID=47886 RepID=UPI003A8C09E8
MQDDLGLLQRITLWASSAGVGYLWFVLLAIWGGTASYVTRIRKNQSPFSFVELIGEWSISGFAGVITAYLCNVAGFSYFATAALAGIAGHMGGRGIALIEHLITDQLKRRYGVKTSDDSTN